VVAIKEPTARHRALNPEPPVPRVARQWHRPRPSRLTAAVVVLGIAATAALSWVTHHVNTRNEARLLNLQTRQTGTVLQVILPTLQTPLASAAEIAATSDGDPAQFRSYMATYLGAAGPFVSAALWRLDPTGPRVVATAGTPSRLDATSTQASAFISTAPKKTELTILGPLAGDRYRLGYAFPSTGAAPIYVVYAESLLPANRRARIQPGSPFANLRFALYLGDSARADKLLETNVKDLPVAGRTSTVVVPFGASSLMLVAGSSTTFGGAISDSLWWIIALAGVAMTVVAAWTAQRLVTGRRAAEILTGEVQTLLGEQRTIAETLQHALLPKQLPELPGVRLTARYVPGTNGVQIGGDWYDVVPLDDGRFFFVVGDVSGRGVEAGSVMASLLFAIRGFVSEGHPPERVLNALAHLLTVERDKHFATVLCGFADIDRHLITVANAGHLPPLLVSDERTEFVASPTGPPIGVARAPAYSATTIPIPAGATLIAYTDGLVERRGETLDDGLRRLMDTASAAGVTGEALVDALMSTLVPDGCDDDTAILGLQWLK
jgi:serine phosphatase RsbU (regulator of sigma subunit)/type II secretory pathway pseudopilin PulG